MPSPPPANILMENHSGFADFPNSLFAYPFSTLYENLQMAWAPSPRFVRCAVVHGSWTVPAWWWSGNNKAFYCRHCFVGLVFLNLGWADVFICPSSSCLPTTGSGLSLITLYHFNFPVLSGLVWVLGEDFLPSNSQWTFRAPLIGIISIFSSSLSSSSFFCSEPGNVFFY